jgi:glycosyltransferase involved in cell wall biosynthesis
VGPRDPAALAERVGRLLDDPALARDMGERGLRRQREAFSRQAMVGAVTALYEQLLSAKQINGPAPTRSDAATGPATQP